MPTVVDQGATVCGIDRPGVGGVVAVQGVVTSATAQLGQAQAGGSDVEGVITASSVQYADIDADSELIGAAAASQVIKTTKGDGDGVVAIVQRRCGADFQMVSASVPIRVLTP